MIRPKSPAEPPAPIDADEAGIHVATGKHVLTDEEFAELRWMARQSMLVKRLLMLALAVLSLLGIPHVIDFMEKHWK